MERCLQLAQIPGFKVFPNPMVGSVLVYKDKVIGEGFHQNYGSAHAEVNAIESVLDKSLLTNSTLYVNLEPCCHWGKTPPCSNLIIQSGIKKVIIGCLDPNPLVSGKGVQILEENGITTQTGILENECLNLNTLFFNQLNQKSQPIRFVLKWAESLDGFIGKLKYDIPEQHELSNPFVKRWVHKMRSEVDAIMIGTNTALIDNPQLNNRFWSGPSPKIILLDRYLKIPIQSQIFKSDQMVFVFNEVKNEISNNVIYLRVNFQKNNQDFWQNIQSKLSENGIRSVLLEGGGFTLQSFINSGFQASLFKIKTNHVLGEGILAPNLQFQPQEEFILGNNTIEYYHHNAF